MTHQHTFYRFGDTFHCICGESRADTRTDEQRDADMERATLAVKVRVNKALGIESPNMTARIAELSR